MISTYEPLILAWADDEYVIGQQLVTLVGMYGPDLEEAVAIGSIAQDHLGHALKLYGMLCKDEVGVNQLIYERKASEYRSSHLADAWRPDDWTFTVVKQFLYDLANYEREQWAAGFDEPWPGLVGMMRRETELHIAHWSEWCRLLMADPHGQESLSAALATLWPLACDFFVTPIDAPDAWTSLCDAWRGAVEAILRPGDLYLTACPSDDQGLTSGRNGIHRPELEPLLLEAHAYHVSHPTWRWE
jgi:phenylacetate-CoA oxygenase PaaI subunit